MVPIYNLPMPKHTPNKTVATAVPVEQFLATVADERKQQDARALVRLMTQISGEPAVLWGPSIIGFGLCHYKYASGREGDMGVLGFSPRKDALTIYLVEGTERHAELLARLGPHKLGKCCLYIKRLADVDLAVLEALLRSSYEYVMARRDNLHKVE